MKTHSDFLAAIVATIGKNPDPARFTRHAIWTLKTDYGALEVSDRFQDSSRLNLRFTGDFPPGVEKLGANPRTGRWDIMPGSIPTHDGPEHLLALQRESIVSELSKRLARVGYVPPVAPLPGNDTGIPDDEPQGEPATGLGNFIQATGDPGVLKAGPEERRWLVPNVVLVNSADQPFPGLRVLEIRATDDGLRVAVELDGFVWDPEVGDFRAWRSKDGTGHIMLGPASVPGQDMVRINEHAVGTQKLDKAAREFVAKVERGEARSTRSYAAFKEALKLIDGAPVSPVRYFRNPKTGKEWRVAPGERVKYRTYSPEPSEWRKSASDLEMLEAGEQFMECDEHGNPLTGGKEGQ